LVITDTPTATITPGEYVRMVQEVQSAVIGQNNSNFSNATA